MKTLKSFVSAMSVLSIVPALILPAQAAGTEVVSQQVLIGTARTCEAIVAKNPGYRLTAQVPAEGGYVCQMVGVLNSTDSRIHKVKASEPLQCGVIASKQRQWVLYSQGAGICSFANILKR